LKLRRKFDTCATRPREAVGREPMEQPLRRRSEYVIEMVLLRKIWMVWNFEGVRGPWLEKALSMGR
jgi:hypothetical protein